ncbi:hypothetical protein [Tolypothrix sp. NIES-4075]|uniref:hypothetical protein n=1 Tax=Tolypothrix sp. NIES-4075 TaxID=2005459 RepID=UPI00117BFBBE|nr:hypothetical protein [Tolypothrix sp. NIES-4075]
MVISQESLVKSQKFFSLISTRAVSFHNKKEFVNIICDQWLPAEVMERRSREIKVCSASGG